MKNTTKIFSLKICTLLAFLLLGYAGFAQSIPSSSNGTDRCAICAPSGWFVEKGTPDISDRNIVAHTTTAGGGANWTQNVGGNTNFQLPLPPNGHDTWITIRDLGNVSNEEIIATTMTGLVVGRVYEVIVYSLSAVTRANGNSSQRYAGEYIDKFDFQVGTTSSPRISVENISRNTWGVNALRFTATATSMNLYLYPGYNAGTTHTKYEAVNISLTLNAINTAPVAGDDIASTMQGTSVTINVLDNDNEYDEGQILVEGSVDLEPSTPGIQSSVATSQGTWTVDNGIVTFTPAPGFSGTATIPYTVQDNYTVSGSNPLTAAPATSNQATISVNVEAIPCNGTQTTYTLDVATTFANNTIAPNGGTLTLTFSRSSGPPIPGVADSFTIPITYSGMNNTMSTGAVNQWESLAVGTGGLAGYVVILPITTKTSGGIYHKLPASNQVSLPINANANNTDKLFNHYLGNGTIQKIGNFSIEFGNFPTVFPAGVSVVEQSLTVRQAGNSGVSSSGSTFHSIGYLLKPDLQNDLQPVDGIASTNAFSVQPGQTYTYWYSAFDDNLGVTATNAGNRGAGINGSITLCYDEDHCNAGTDQVPLSGNTLSNY